MSGHIAIYVFFADTLGNDIHMAHLSISVVDSSVFFLQSNAAIPYFIHDEWAESEVGYARSLRIGSTGITLRMEMSAVDARLARRRHVLATIETGFALTMLYIVLISLRPVDAPLVSDGLINLVEDCVIVVLCLMMVELLTVFASI